MGNNVEVREPMKLELTPEIVKKYICPIATEQEIYMFLQLCKGQNLNPFLKDAYLIKYSAQQPAAIVTGKDVFLRRARQNPNYKGFKAGVVVEDSEGKTTYREGGIVFKKECLLGGWCEVYREDRIAPIRSEVAFDEYAGRKADGELNRQWSGKPATMIRKVPIVQAHREAFDELEGCYAIEEFPHIDITTLPEYSEDKTAPGYIEPPKAKTEAAKEKHPEGPPKDPPKDLCVEINRMLLEMEGNEVNAGERLKSLTGFMTKDRITDGEKWIEGKADPKEFSEKNLPVAYGKVKRVYEEWKAGGQAA